MITKKIKKNLAILLSTLTLLALPSCASASEVVEKNTDKVISREGSTSYKYWTITSSSYYSSRKVGSEKFLKTFYAENNNDQFTVTHSEKQTGSVCIGLSVAYNAVGASIGYTPGTSMNVYVSTTSAPYAKGSTVKAYRTLREDIFKIYQKEYIVDHPNGITNAPTGNTKTGTAYKPAAPSIRFEKV